MSDSHSSEFDVALATVAAPTPEPSEAQLISDTLAEAGYEVPEHVVFELDKLIDALAMRRAGEALHQLSLRLPRKSAAGAALARVIRGSEGESLRQAGKRCGVSQVAILKAEKRIRRALEVNSPPP